MYNINWCGNVTIDTVSRSADNLLKNLLIVSLIDLLIKSLIDLLINPLTMSLVDLLVI